MSNISKFKPVLILIIIILPIALITYDYKVTDIAVTNPDFNDTATIDINNRYEEHIFELPIFTRIYLTISNLPANREIVVYLMDVIAYDGYIEDGVPFGQYTENVLNNSTENLIEVVFDPQIDLYLVITTNSADTLNLGIQMDFLYSSYYEREGLGIILYVMLYILFFNILQYLISDYHKKKAVKSHIKKRIKEEDDFFDRAFGKLD